MHPNQHPSMYLDIHGNVQYAAQPAASTYPPPQAQQPAYNTSNGAVQQGLVPASAAAVLRAAGPVEQHAEYGQGSNSLHNNHLPHSMGYNMQVVGSGVIPTANQSFAGSGVIPTANQNLGNNPMGGGAEVPSMGVMSQVKGPGMGISEGFPCVRLRGLPFEANEQDVEVWLETEPLDIILVKRNGVRTGEAFVLLRLPIQVEHALNKNKTYIGSRYIEVALAKKLDFYREIYVMVRDDEESKTALRSQRVGSREHSVREHVSRTHSRRDSPSRKRSSRRGSSSERGSSKRHHRDEPRERDRSYAETEEVPEKEHTGLLKLRGLPFAATQEDVVQWFARTAELSVDSVHLVMGSGNRPMGQAIVQFASTEASQAAMAMDRKLMGSRYIELFVSDPNEAAKFGAPFR